MLVAILCAVTVYELVVDRRLKIRQGEHTATLLLEPRFDAIPLTYFSRTLIREVTLVDASYTLMRGKPVRETFDQFGMRAPTIMSEFGSKCTLALIGDSFTFGAEVEYEDTLQAHIARRFPNWNVVNFGVNGSNSWFYPGQAKSFISGIGLHPKLYVVSIYKDMRVGDVPRREASQIFGGRAVFRGVPVSESRFKRLTTSPLARLLFESEIFLRENLSIYNTLLPLRPANEFAIDVHKSTSPETMARWKAGILRSLHDLQKVAQVRIEDIVIWLVPSNIDLAEKTIAQRKHRPPPDYIERFERFWADVARDFENAGFIVVDPSSDIFLLPTDGIYPFTASGHFRPTAYKIVAAHVLPRLAQRIEGYECHAPKN